MVVRGISLAAVLLALAACGPLDTQSSANTAIPEKSDASSRATSILNAGVMTQHSVAAGESVKFLFDPLYDDHFGSLEELTPDLIEAIISGAAPYDGVDAVFVSHAHGDHFSVSQLTRMLEAQPDLVLVVPSQGFERLRESPDWNPDFEPRIHSITLENGEASKPLKIAGASVDAFRSPHAGWPDRHANVHNITFRVSVSGNPNAGKAGSVNRVMHLGDADPSPEHYEALKGFLEAKRTGLAFVPFWFTGREDLDTIIDDVLNAESMVAVHVPAKVPARLKEGEWTYFSEAGQIVEIPTTP